MAINVNISITVEADGYTAHEQAILTALAAHPSNGAAAVLPDPAPAAAEAPKKPAAKRPAPKAAEGRRQPDPDAGDKLLAEAKEAAAEEPAAAADPEQAEEQAASAPGVTRQDVVDLATKVIAAGKKEALKSALASVGAGRVSEVTDAKLGDFHAALQAA